MTVSYSIEMPRARSLLEAALSRHPPRLDWAALALCALELPDVDVGSVERQLDSLAARVRALAPSPRDTLAQFQALRRILGDEEAFWGNTDDYSAAENSFLNLVLERKQGLPITLSVLYLEVARRAGIPLFGVAFPGHFLVASETGAGKLLMDPFQGGAILTETGCADLLSRVSPQVRFASKMVVPASVKTITSRMLMNLKRTYLAAGEREKALRVLELVLMLSPDHPGELRARANVLSALGAYRAALADVERCLELSPEAPDNVNLRLTARALRQRVDYLN